MHLAYSLLLALLHSQEMFLAQSTLVLPFTPQCCLCCPPMRISYGRDFLPFFFVFFHYFHFVRLKAIWPFSSIVYTWCVLEIAAQQHA